MCTPTDHPGRSHTANGDKRISQHLFNFPPEIDHRPPLRVYVPHFIFLLTINLFSCLVLPTQSLKNVKSSHQVDFAYLYYLPFCSVFTSKDNFHRQCRSFVNGTEFKNELKGRNEYGEKKLGDELERKSDSVELRLHDERESDRMQSSKESRLICTIVRV